MLFEDFCDQFIREFSDAMVSTLSECGVDAQEQANLGEIVIAGTFFLQAALSGDHAFCEAQPRRAERMWESARDQGYAIAHAAIVGEQGTTTRYFDTLLANLIHERCGDYEDWLADINEAQPETERQNLYEEFQYLLLDRFGGSDLYGTEREEPAAEAVSHLFFRYLEQALQQLQELKGGAERPRPTGGRPILRRVH